MRAGKWTSVMIYSGSMAGAKKPGPKAPVKWSKPSVKLCIKIPGSSKYIVADSLQYDLPGFSAIGLLISVF